MPTLTSNGQYTVTLDGNKFKDQSHLANTLGDDYIYTFTLDTAAPLIQTKVPQDNATGVPVSANLVLTFNELVYKGTGDITITRADNNVFETIPVTDSKVTVTGMQVTINPTNNFAPDTGYDVLIDAGAIKDLAGNDFAGITDTLPWKFTTASVASISLAISALDAEKHEGNSGTTPFTFTVTRTGDTTGTASVEWAVTGSSTHPANAADFSGGQFPTGTVSFAAGETTKPITVPVAGDTIEERDEQFTVTLSNATSDATITTATAIGVILNDDPPPLLEPADNATNVPLDRNLVLTFNASVKKGTGDITIKRTADNSVFETIPVTEDKVTIDGAVVTINPTNNFVSNTGYYVQIAAGAIQDLAGNGFAGITDAETWSFATEPSVPEDGLRFRGEPTADGTMVHFHVQGASSGGFLGFAFGPTTAAATFRGYGVAIPLKIHNPVIFAGAFANLSGDAFAALPVPAHWQGQTIHYQVFEIGPDPNASAVLTLNPGHTGGDGSGSAGMALTVTIDLPDRPVPSKMLFQAAFSAPVSGFTADAVQLTGTAAGAVIERIVPADDKGQTFQIVVSGMSGAGTVAVGVPEDAVFDEAGRGNLASISPFHPATFDPADLAGHRAEDVNADGFVTPADALALINFLNHIPSNRTINALGAAFPYRFDVNDDSMVSALDVLIIINTLNHPQPAGAEGEWSGPADVFEPRSSSGQADRDSQTHRGSQLTPASYSDSPWRLDVSRRREHERAFFVLGSSRKIEDSNNPEWYGMEDAVQDLTETLIQNSP